MKELIILVGNIGSGKSTVATKYQKKDFVIISQDALRYAIGGGKYIYNEDYEDTIINTSQYMFKRFIKLESNLVIDNNNVTKEYRESYINLAKKAKYKITCVVMPRLSQEDSVKRRMANNHGNHTKEVWVKVWQNFYDRYETPSVEEGFDIIINYEEKKQESE